MHQNTGTELARVASMILAKVYYEDTIFVIWRRKRVCVGVSRGPPGKYVGRITEIGEGRRD